MNFTILKMRTSSMKRLRQSLWHGQFLMFVMLPIIPGFQDFLPQKKPYSQNTSIISFGRWLEFGRCKGIDGLLREPFFSVEGTH